MQDLYETIIPKKVFMVKNIFRSMNAKETELAMFKMK